MKPSLAMFWLCLVSSRVWAATPAPVPAAPTCLDAFAAHLAQCVPFTCDDADPRLEGKKVHVQVLGRQKGLCLATGMVPGQGQLNCEFEPTTVRYLTAPGTIRALKSPDLEVSVRPPDGLEEIAAAIHGHPLLLAQLKGHPLDTSGISRDCALSLPDTTPAPKNK